MAGGQWCSGEHTDLTLTSHSPQIGLILAQTSGDGGVGALRSPLCVQKHAH